MTTPTISPSITAFLSQPEDDLHDGADTSRGPVEAVLAERAGHGDPLESIADSLRQLVGMVTKHSEDEQLADRRLELLDDLEAKHAELYDVLAQVEKIVAKSTSKVSLDVKAAINAWRNPDAAPAEPAGDEPEPMAQPAPDAEVEEWRAYARSLGYAGAPVEQGNRSQIRTLLGVEQPVTE